MLSTTPDEVGARFPRFVAALAMSTSRSRRKRPGGAAARTALPSRADVRRCRAGDLARPRDGASQLRDSAGMEPDFAAATPAGDMCPTARGYARGPDGVLGLSDGQRGRNRVREHAA